MKRVLSVLMAAIILAMLTGCGSKYDKLPEPIATITMRDGGVMRLRLFVSKAPNTVANFVYLANSGFYDGMQIYKVLPGCFIQSGDPLNDGTGGPGYSIKGEFAENGFKNDISHTRGTISMARASGFDSAGSQFFILQGSYPEYDGKYAAFGRIADEESLNTLDSIGLINVDTHYTPLKPIYIDTIRVETGGYSYEPVRIEEEEE